MDETMIPTSKDYLEELKAKLAEAKANLRSARINIVKSKVNTAKAKVGTFLRRNVDRFRNSIGLLPLMVESRIMNLANKWELKRTARINKRTERRKIIISRIDTAKAKVGRFNKKVVNGVKNAINKVKDFFRTNPEKRQELLEELRRQREELEALRQENKRLREEGSYKNLKGSRGSVNYLTIFTITLIVFGLLATVVIWQIIK